MNYIGLTKDEFDSLDEAKGRELISSLALPVGLYSFLSPDGRVFTVDTTIGDQHA